MGATARAAAVGAVIVLAGCLDAPPAGDPDDKSDAGGVVSTPDAGDCQVEPACLPASDFRDAFVDLSAWTTVGADCLFEEGDAMRITRNGSDNCVARTLTPVDLRCSSFYVHVDPVVSEGSDATLSFIVDEKYYYIERKPPMIEMGVCPPLETCTTLESTDYVPELHLHWRLRATATAVVAEVGGPDTDLTWTRLGEFPDVDPADLGCGTIELGNYVAGDTPSTARFFELNL